MHAADVTAWLVGFAARHHGIVCGRAARGAGISYAALDHRCRRGELIRLTPGVYRMRDHPATWESRLWAALIEAGPGAVVGLRSAGRLHGLWRYRNNEAIEIVKRRGSSHKARLGRLFEASLIDPDHLVEIAGFPVTSVARTIFDLAGDPDQRPLRSEAAKEWHENQMMAVINDAMRHHGLTVLIELGVLGAIGRRGKPGTALIRKIFTKLSDDYVPDDSQVESLFSALLTRSDMPPPVKQLVICDAAGFIGRVDYAWPHLQIVVEIDSKWHDGPLDKQRDKARDRRLEALGYTVFRWRWTDLVTTPDQVLRKLHRAAARGANPR